MLPPESDPIRPGQSTSVTLTLDGESLTGISGQSIAGVMMAHDQLTVRHTASEDRPRGVFCGIGVCFDCLVEVNGLQDVRACQRKARDGDVVNTVRAPEMTEPVTRKPQAPQPETPQPEAPAPQSHPHGGAA